MASAEESLLRLKMEVLRMHEQHPHSPLWCLSAYPRTIRVDNGSEYVSRDVDLPTCYTLTLATQLLTAVPTSMLANYTNADQVPSRTLARCGITSN